MELMKSVYGSTLSVATSSAETTCTGGGAISNAASGSGTAIGGAVDAYLNASVKRRPKKKDARVESFRNSFLNASEALQWITGRDKKKTPAISRTPASKREVSGPYPISQQKPTEINQENLPKKSTDDLDFFENYRPPSLLFASDPESEEETLNVVLNSREPIKQVCEELPSDKRPASSTIYTIADQECESVLIEVAEEFSCDADEYLVENDPGNIDLWVPDTEKLENVFKRRNAYRSFDTKGRRSTKESSSLTRKKAMEKRARSEDAHATNTNEFACYISERSLSPIPSPSRLISHDEFWAGREPLRDWQNLVSSSDTVDAVGAKSLDFSNRMDLELNVKEIQIGEQYIWNHRKNCLDCQCDRSSHAVGHEEQVSVEERLGMKERLKEQRDPKMAERYTWIPAGLSPGKVDEYMRLLPSDKVPLRGSAGENWREHQLSVQLPRQDLTLQYCRHLEVQHRSDYTSFVTARNEIALDIGYVKEATARPMACYGCGSRIPTGSMAVMAPKFGDSAAWHPSCFSCSACGEILVDLTHCVHDDQLFCERHYAEQLKPRCSACDELIFSGEYTKAMSKDWHLGHFSCWQCDESLTGQRYVLRDDHPYCVKCYESNFANTCDECNKLIGIDSKDLSYKERHWHEACFLCFKCRVSLVDKQFGSKAEKIYCGPCYDSQFATRCDACGEVFRAGTKKMEYKSRQWHEKCFSCCTCKTPIGTKSFIPRDQDIYCTGCYEDKFATRCIKCSKIITTGGVTYKSEPWHRECFTCTHCTTPLAGQRFTSRDDKPYCADCFGELFAKRCTACVKPITGIGGTRFISFEDRHWHNDCFTCAQCKCSLVGKGFITDGADILCPECAKQRVM